METSTTFKYLVYLSIKDKDWPDLYKNLKIAIISKVPRWDGAIP